MNKILLVLALVFTTALCQTCSNVTYVKNGNACTQPASPGASGHLRCLPSLSCDNTTNKCRPAPAIGTTCTSNGQCTQDVFPLETVSLKCINGKCNYGRHVGLKCQVGSDCRTGICSNSTCGGLPLGASCMAKQCIDFNTTQLYCHPTTKNCTRKGMGNDPCTSSETCISGYVCHPTTKKCIFSIPQLNTACAQQADCMYRGSIPTGLVCYPDGKCKLPNMGNLNANCTTGAHCQHNLGCKSNKCQNGLNVTCTEQTKSNCGSGDCICATSQGGVCSPNPARQAATQCVNHLLAISSCLFQKCPGNLLNVNPFGATTGNCAQLCLKEAVAYICCLQKTTPGYVLPGGGLPPIQCTTPQPSPKPTPKPTPKPPGKTPQPGKTPKLSSGSRVVISLFTVCALALFLF